MSRPKRFNFCESSFLYNCLQNEKNKAFIIDTRDSQDFDAQSIPDSVNLSYDHIQQHFEKKNSQMSLSDLSLASISDMMNTKNKEKLKNIKRVFCILIISQSSFPQEFINKTKKMCDPSDLLDYCSLSQQVIGEDFEKASDEMPDQNSVAVGKAIYKLLLDERVVELYILLDGAKSFFTRYPYMDPAFHESPKEIRRSDSFLAKNLELAPSFTFDFPHDIWSNKLFLGSFNQASQYMLVKNLNITHVVNVTAECTNVHENQGIKYLHIVVLDEMQVDVLKFFQEAYEFIESALSADPGHKVLVHCALGKSRSATVTIMYLMKKFKLGASQALEYVKNKRNIVDPNHGFIDQLHEFEKRQYNFERETPRL